MEYKFVRSTYGTYIIWEWKQGTSNQGRQILSRGEKMYETTNKMKAWGVTEYLNNKERGLA